MITARMRATALHTVTTMAVVTMEEAARVRREEGGREGQIHTGGGGDIDDARVLGRADEVGGGDGDLVLWMDLRAHHTGHVDGHTLPSRRYSCTQLVLFSVLLVPSPNVHTKVGLQRSVRGAV